MFFVYSIFNKLNGKIYIGKTNDPERRWRRHRRTAKDDDNYDKFYIHRAIAKYGVNNFTFTAFQTFEKEEDCNAAEIYWIKFFNCRDSKFGYNLTNGGEGCSGRVFSEETIEKMRQKALGRKHTPETLEKISGDNNHRSKLTSIQVKEIREKYATKKYTILSLAETYEVHPRCISHVIYNRDWYDENYDAPKPREGNYQFKPKLTKENVLEIRKLLSEGAEMINLAEKFNVTKTNIKMIRDRKTWSDI